VKELGGLDTGSTLDQYELLVPVAKGGMAIVWAARLKGALGFQKIVAIKTMLPALSQDGAFAKMFLAEARLASQIRHPNVCGILDVGEQDGVLYIVMEWLDGEPLSLIHKAARAKGDVPITIATRIGIQAAHGLHAAHELKGPTGELLGLVHRDVSPQNILVTHDGEVKIVDFGVARADDRSDELSQAGNLKGKVLYMAPEQADAKRVDRRADVFALGVVLYEVITGKHPFKAQNDLATLTRLVDGAPVTPPTWIAPRVTPALNAALVRALEKDPAKRFPTMREFGRSLEASLAKMVMHGNDLALFVREFRGGRGDKKRELIAEAERVADERAERLEKERTPPPPPPAQTSSSRPPERAADAQPPVVEAAAPAQSATTEEPLVLAAREPERPAPTGVAPALSTRANEGATERAPIPQQPVVRPQAPPRARWRVWLQVVALLAIATEIGVLLIARSGTPDGAPAPAGTSSPSGSESAPGPSALPVESAAPSAPEPAVRAPGPSALPAESAAPSAAEPSVSATAPAPSVSASAAEQPAVDAASPGPSPAP
jgi:eukaryotic-like serine/threonine-protein kinase